LTAVVDQDHTSESTNYEAEACKIKSGLKACQAKGESW
jgi:hypothetical protein